MKRIILIICLIIAIFQMVVISANLFADGFEGGTTGAWSAVLDTESDITVTTAAALHGVYGLSLLIDNTTSMYVRDDTPNIEIIYRFRFYLDPNSLIMANNELFSISQGISDTTMLLVDLKYTTVLGYIIIARARDDASVYTEITKNSLSDAPHCIEVYWKAATGAGNNDGYTELFVDGISIGSLTTIDNDTRYVSSIRFGVATGLDAGTSGTFYLDDFASNNDGSAIGVISETPAGNAIMFGINF